MATNNFQLQGNYTRYEDGHHIGFDTIEGPNRRRNYKTLDNAIRAAKKELRRNSFTPIVRSETERYGSGKYDYTIHYYAEDGRELSVTTEPCEFWHTDAIRIVDRETQEVLWES